MAFRLIPKEERFYDDFEAMAVEISKGARLLQDMLAPDRPLMDKAEEIKEVEHKCDFLTHEIIKRLHRTFVTPLDRDEIHQLITGMDDVLDLMEDVATCLFLYDVKSVTPDAQKLGEICVTCTGKLKEAVAKLESMDNADAILRLCGDIDRLEGEAEFVFRSALARLFREEEDVKQIIKLKEVYQLLESITDKCEDVANVIEGIVLENA